MYKFEFNKDGKIESIAFRDLKLCIGDLIAMRVFGRKVSVGILTRIIPIRTGGVVLYFIVRSRTVYTKEFITQLMLYLPLTESVLYKFVKRLRNFNSAVYDRVKKKVVELWLTLPKNL